MLDRADICLEELIRSRIRIWDLFLAPFSV